MRTDNITVQPHVRSAEVRDKIEAAFKRSAEIDARRISVTAQDGKVILSGNMRSWAERQEAERAGWAAPGVTQVDDRDLYYAVAAVREPRLVSGHRGGSRVPSRSRDGTTYRFRGIP